VSGSSSSGCSIVVAKLCLASRLMAGGLKGWLSLSPLTTLAAASPAVAGLVTAVAFAYLLLLAVAVLTATLHPDRDRRADARCVLTALLAVLLPRRRR